MEKINIYLDDLRSPDYVKEGMGEYYPSNWVIIRNYFDFINFVPLNLYNIGIISFDHDIASYDDKGKEYTGKDAVNFLINLCMDKDHYFPDWYVHTDNIAGGPNIISMILSYLKNVENKNYQKDWRYFNKGIINGNII